MAYLYGDSTPFPLSDNFIDTLRDATEACVALLRIDEQLDELYDRQDVARTEAGEEQRRLEGVAGAVVRALEPHLGGVDSVSAGQVAVRVLNAARGVLEGARADVSNRRDAVLREVESAIAAARDGIPRALEQLLARRALPEMTWTLRWTAGIAEAPSQATSEGRAACKLMCAMDIDIPASSIFSRPVRAADMEKGVAVRLPAPGRILRSHTRLEKHSLDGMFITEAEITPERASMTLRRSSRHPSPGLEIVVRSQGESWPTARRLTETGMGLGEPVVLDGIQGLGVQRLWAKVEASLGMLEKRRARLLRATLDNRPVRDIDRPTTIAQRMIGVLAPIVREMRRRSAANRELVLKRDLESGRREEIWISREELTARFAALSPARRSLFDAFGLSGAGADDPGENDPTRDYGLLVEIQSDDDTHERAAVSA